MGVLFDELAASERVRICAAFGIPVDSEYPGTAWIANLASDSDLPSDVELAQLASYIDFMCEGFYGGSVTGRPAKVAGHNTVSVRFCDGGWFYRRRTWQSAGLFPYRHLDDYVPLSLRQLLDRHVVGHVVTAPDGSVSYATRDDWEAWKAARPDVWPPEPA